MFIDPDIFKLVVSLVQFVTKKSKRKLTLTFFSFKKRYLSFEVSWHHSPVKNIVYTSKEVKSYGSGKIAHKINYSI